MSDSYQKESPIGSTAKAQRALSQLKTHPKSVETTDQLMVIKEVISNFCIAQMAHPPAIPVFWPIPSVFLEPAKFNCAKTIMGNWVGYSCIFSFASIATCK